MGVLLRCLEQDDTTLDQVPARLAVFGGDRAYEATVGQIRREYAAVICVENLRECIAELLHILRIPLLPQAQSKTARTHFRPQERISQPGVEPKRPFQDFQRTLRTDPRYRPPHVEKRANLPVNHTLLTGTRSQHLLV